MYLVNLSFLLFSFCPFMSLGIGFCTAMELATRNARIIMACRNLEKGEKAMEKIQTETGNTKLVLHEVDVSSMKSVRTFANRINSMESEIDILVNNAGITGVFY